MPNYDFRSLSPFDFETLVRDLLQAELQTRIESFKSGRDGGIDLRYSLTEDRRIIIQCKHYVETGFNGLASHLERKEKQKIHKIKPARYVLCTSVGLTPANKEKLKTILSPYCAGTEDIFGQDDLNNLLGRHPEVEKQSFKLWLTSVAVLQSVLQKKVFLQGAMTMDEIRRRFSLYVENNSLTEIRQVLDEANYCIISGIPGIGKTTLAEIILTRYINKGWQIVTVTSDVGEALSVFNHSVPQVFYYDDFLGQSSLGDKLNKNEETNIIRLVEAVRHAKNKKFILTTREYILQQAKTQYERLERSGIEAKKCIVTLEDYSQRQKAEILYNHLYFYSVNHAYLEHFVTERQYMHIIKHRNYNPRIIEWMCKTIRGSELTPAEYSQRFFNLLEKPMEIWNHAFHNQLSEFSRHLLIVLTILPEETRLDDVTTAYREYQRTLARKYGIPVEKNALKKALAELDDTFLKIRFNRKHQIISFHNPSVLDFMSEILRSNRDEIEDCLQSTVFFEQIERLGALLGPIPGALGQLPSVKENPSLLIKAIDRTIQAKPVSNVFGFVSSNTRSKRIFQERMVELARLLLPSQSVLVKNMVIERIESVFTSEKIPVSMRVRFLKNGEATGLAKEQQFDHWLKITIQQLESEPIDVFAHEMIAELVTALPSYFPQAYREAAALRFAMFVESDYQPVIENATDPEELQSYHRSIESAANVFNFEADSILKEIEDTIYEIQRNQEPPDDDDDGWRDSRNKDESDTAIDVMFRSLID